MPPRDTVPKTTVNRQDVHALPGRASNLTKEVLELRRENTRLQERLQEAEAILDIHVRASRILGIPVPPQ